MGTVSTEATTSQADSEASATDEATFTKWLVGEGPEMAGVVGGAVGDGAYAGKVLEMHPGPTTTVEAIYRFNGSKRPFAALVHVEQTGLQAVITGVVIDGWGKGNPVKGRYTEIKCDHDGITTDCWQGSFDIAREAEQ